MSEYTEKCVKCGKWFDCYHSHYFCSECESDHSLGYCIYCKEVFSVKNPSIAECPNGCVVPAKPATLYR